MRVANRFGLKLKEATQTHGVATAIEVLRDALKNRRIQRHDLSLQEMAGSFMGENWEAQLSHYYDMMRGGASSIALRESADAVDASGFAEIGGQLLVDIVRDKYVYATQASDKMFTKMPVGQNLGTHIEPWLSDVLDEGATVNQLQPYPFTQFIHQTVTYPAPIKRGRICAVSVEMIRADKTQQAFESAESVGKRLGLQIHKERMKVVLGITNNHVFNGTSFNTYLASGAWVNLLDNFTLNSWRDVNRIEQLFNQMVDPVTGEVIEIEGMQCLVMPFNKHNARRILNATETRSGDITTGTGDQIIAGNPLDAYELLVDKHSRKLLLDSGLTAAKTETVTIWGDFRKAFVEREVWPMTVVQAAPNNIWEFTRDIALAVKASVYNIQGVRDPRYVIKAFNDSAS